MTGDTIILFEVSCGRGDNSEENKLSDLVPNWKTLTSKEINDALDEEYREWQLGLVSGGWTKKEK